jgi:hypothetical protein
MYQEFAELTVRGIPHVATKDVRTRSDTTLDENVLHRQSTQVCTSYDYHHHDPSIKGGNISDMDNVTEGKVEKERTGHCAPLLLLALATASDQNVTIIPFLTKVGTTKTEHAFGICRHMLLYCARVATTLHWLEPWWRLTNVQTRNICLFRFDHIKCISFVTPTYCRIQRSILLNSQRLPFVSKSLQ